jgi:hypothetical protein
MKNIPTFLGTYVGSEEFADIVNFDTRDNLALVEYMRQQEANVEQQAGFRMMPTTILITENLADARHIMLIYGTNGLPVVESTKSLGFATKTDKALALHA